MSPDQIEKTSEHSIQSASFAWLNKAVRYGVEIANDMTSYTKEGLEANLLTKKIKPLTRLRTFHAIPNGTNLGNTEEERKIRGGRAKAEGVRKGVLDTFLPVGSQGFNGLYIEFKTKTGSMEPEQITFAQDVTEEGYHVEIARSWRECAKILTEYLD